MVKVNCAAYPKLFRDTLLGCTVIHVYIFPTHIPLKRGAIKAGFISESLVEGKVQDSSRLPGFWWNLLQVPMLSLMLFVSHPCHLVDPLKAAFKYQLLWVLLKYFINVHLSQQG